MRARIIRFFFHTHSHMEKISEAGCDLSVLSEVPVVFTDFLALLRANDKQLYDAMMAFV